MTDTKTAIQMLSTKKRSKSKYQIENVTLRGILTNNQDVVGKTFRITYSVVKQCMRPY